MVWPESFREMGSLQRATKEERKFHPRRSPSVIPFGKVKKIMNMRFQ